MGNEDLISHWLQTYGEMVLRTAYYYVQDKMVAEDIAQEVFIKAYKNIDEFQGKSSIQTWLYSITTNQSKDYLRSWFRRIKLLNKMIISNPSVDHESPETIFLKKDTSISLLDKIMRLPVKYREVIILYYLEGLSQKEIAEILYIKEATIRTRLSRALKQLRLQMEEGCPDGVSTSNTI